MFELLLSDSSIHTCVVIFVVLLIVHWFLKRNRYNMPPGPLCLPLVGNWFRPLKMVVVNDLKSAMEVLVKKSTEFAGRHTPPSVKYNTYGSKDIAFAPYSRTWKLQRQIASKALRVFMRGNALERRIHSALQTVLTVLDKQIGAFDPENTINFLVANILTGLCFSGKFEYDNKELLHVIKKADEYLENFNNEFIPEDVFPPLQYIYQSKGMKRIVRLTKEMMTDFIGKRFYEERKTFNKDNIRHFTDTLLLAREEVQEKEGEKVESLTDDHLIQTLSDVFLGGLDTSRTTLMFAILHMIAFPDIQSKVQKELDREIGTTRLPRVADRPNLGYTEAVLHESMRLATVAPSGVTHKALCDTDIAGYKLPKGTLVMINHWALHHDPNAWDEVDKFKPERYLDENGRLGPKPDNWLPFSAGRRVCLGEFVAKPELHLLFAGLMQQFTWRAEQGVNVDIKPQGTVFVAMPVQYKVILSRRIGSKQ